MKKTVIAIVVVLCFCHNGIAQQTKSQTKSTSGKAKVSVYGFVRNYFNYDSRQTVTVCGGDYHLIPFDEDWNMTLAEEAALLGTGVAAPDGMTLRYDRNAEAQAHFLALSSRIGLALTGSPDLLGASTSGRFEADFAGFGTNNTILRIRLAYLKLTWNSDDGRQSLLTVGQDWHPLCGDVMPEALGMAAGSPFRPHSRTPQLRYVYSIGPLGFTAAAMYQYQFTSPGPGGESAKYANRSLLPELFAGVHYANDHVYSQIGIDYSRLSVSTEVPLASNPSYTALAKKFCHSFSPTFCLYYDRNLFSLKMRSTLAQNLGHLNMISGYAAVTDGVDLTNWVYKPLTALSSFVDLAYGKRWRANLLLGYFKNLGLPEGYSILDGSLGNMYMKKGVKNVDDIWRIAPSLSYNTQAFNIGAEYECTAVGYGDVANDATVDFKRRVTNHRISILIKYNF